MITCPKCGATNRDTSKFCRACGGPLTAPSSGALCPNCGQQNRLGAKHCRRCSEPLSATRACPHCQTENRVVARHCTRCGKSLMANAQPRLGTGELKHNKVVNARYQIINLIAQGGMGAVYLSRDLRLSEPAYNREKFWALKEMSQTAFASDQLTEAIKMFQTEARMLALLKHPNLPEVTDLFEFESKHYLVLEYIRGKTLDEILKKNKAPLPLGDALKWANQLFGVFQYLHGQQPPIIYRDLKPGNLMLEDESGLLKLIDFGIARFQRKRTSKQLLLPGLALDDAGIGTPGYAAPEQWKQGDLHAPQSDIYSMGVVLHQLLTKHDPTASPFHLPPISQLNPGVPEKIAQVIAKGYALNQTDRFVTMQEFQNAFHKAWLASFGGWKVP